MNFLSSVNISWWKCLKVHFLDKYQCLSRYEVVACLHTSESVYFKFFLLQTRTTTGKSWIKSPRMRTRMDHLSTTRRRTVKIRFCRKMQPYRIPREIRGNHEDLEDAARPQEWRLESWVADRPILKSGRGWRLFSGKARFNIAGVCWSPIDMYLLPRTVFTGKLLSIVTFNNKRTYLKQR